MSSDVVANPPVTTESKSARKKKAKAELAAAQSTAAKAPATPTSEAPTEEAKVNGVETSGENVYIKEIQKNIRNIGKKLNLMQKVDAIISENPDSSLDDLVAARKINPDQKAQALKKPQLQAQLAQLEEQLANYKKIDQDYQDKVAAERELLSSSHKKELEELRDTIKAEAAVEQKKLLKLQYLTLSKFLHTAAAKRQIEEPDTEERQAFEGVLLLVYGGDAQAVDAIEKLTEGSEEIVNNIEGTPTGVAFSQVRETSLAGGPTEDASEPTAYDSSAADAVTTQATSDPTIANASLTELQSNPTAMNGTAGVTETVDVPAASGIGSEAANQAAQEQWDQTVKSSEDPLTESFEMVPRDPAETETGSTLAPTTRTQSWADDTPVEIASTTPAAATNGSDGFHEVTHQRGGRGRGDGRGPFRGRGGRGGERGRGHRGDGRGRGRGFRGRPRGDGPAPSS